MSGRSYWRSLEEYQRSDEFGEMLKGEFPSLFDLWTVDRRELLRLMGASLAFAGMTGCKPVRSEDAVPFVNRPEGFLEGRVEHYATAVRFEGFAQPVLATTSAARPIKLDGNPDHPGMKGGSTPFIQASILDLYDPDRSQEPLFNGKPAAWNDFDRQLASLRGGWRANGGKGLRILLAPTTSPTLLRQIHALEAALPNVGVHLFDPLSNYSGNPQHKAQLDLSKADIVVSLDDDFLGAGAMQAIHGRHWGERHGSLDPGAQLNLFMAETTPTQTGAKADHRLGIAPSRLAMIAEAIAASAGVKDASVRLSQKELDWAKQAGAALRQARGRSVLTVGRFAPLEIHDLALQINRALGAIPSSSAVVFDPGPQGSFIELVRAIEQNSVSSLIIIGANPVYATPGDIPFGSIFSKVPVRIHAGLHVDETAVLSNWHLPLPHALEEWSDAVSPDGLATIIQPVVRPLYDSRSLHEIIAALTADQPVSALNLVRQTWAGELGNAVDWDQALKTGFLATSATPPSKVSAIGSQARLREPGDNEVEIVIRPDPTIHDGSFSNNGWLQELPKPLFKTTWDNVIAISPRLAASLKLDSGGIVRVESGGRSVEGPAWVLPGQPERVVTLYLGYGRTHAGRVGTGAGYDAYRLRSASNPWNSIGTVTSTGASMTLATTQARHLMDEEGENLIRTVSRDHPSALRDEEELDQASFYPKWPEGKPAWGMVIDLDRCIGCNACVLACQAENNIPVVGKEQVDKGRDMAWLRVDRYYSGEPDDPETFFEPVPCMHCEQAPCEMGCPVHATVHSPEGLNLMVYNRCIGTRTCSSYCPYKVRRFNWFDYTTNAPSPTEAQRNPDVTVRGRGVMEKCTYCVQRIEAATVKADIENRAVREGEVMTACQQACPAQAISFGNLADSGSAVAKQRKSPRNYGLLSEQGTRPRTTYLARIAKDDADGKS